MAVGVLGPAAPLLAGGPPGWVLYGVLAVAAVGVTAYGISKATSSADTKTDAQTKTNTCKNCPCKRVVAISRSMSPQAAQHILDAQAAGHPSVLTLDRAGTATRRSASLAGIATQPGMDRDEYPPATFAEGGAGASVRLIPRSDNRSAGGQIGSQLAGATEGCKITMTVVP